MSISRSYDLGPKPLPISRNKKLITSYVDVNQVMNLDGARRFITRFKAEKTALAMDKLAARDQWPEKQEDVRAY